MPDPSKDVSASTATPCELTVLMPCLDEAETIGICVKKAKDFIDSRNIDGEVLVADNGSTDGSREIAEELGARGRGRAQGLWQRPTRRHHHGARPLRHHGRCR